MCIENSRRSACDRCRGQKLRCVRPPKDPHSADPNSLQPCERCIKAGATCIHTVLPHLWRRPSRAQQQLQQQQQQQQQQLHHQNLMLSLGEDLHQHHHHHHRSQSIESAPAGNSQYGRRQPQMGRSIYAVRQTHSQSPNSHAAASVVVTTTTHGPGVEDSNSNNNTTTANNNNTSAAAAPTDLTHINVNNDHHQSQCTAMDFDSFDFGLQLSPPPSGGGHPHKHITTTTTNTTMAPRHDSIISTTTSTGTSGLADLFFSPTSLNTPTLASTRSTVSASSGKERCLQCLSELSLRLLKDFGHDSNNNSNNTNSNNNNNASVELHDILSLRPADNNSNSNNAADMAEAAGPKNTIGRVLEGSHVFLTALEHLAHDHHHLVTTTTTSSECSYSDHGDMYSACTSADEYINLYFDPAPHDSKPTTTTTTSSSSMPSISSSSSSSPTTATTMTATYDLDMPTVLTILTCYTWLLRGFETVFDRVKGALLLQQQQLLPPILPGLHIGGFSLDMHRELQLEVLLQISTVLLTRMDHVLGITNNAVSSSSSSQAAKCQGGGGGGGAGGGGILSRASASAALIETWFGNREGGGNGNGNGNGKRGAGRVQAKIEEVRKILRARQGMLCDN